MTAPPSKAFLSSTSKDLAAFRAAAADAIIQHQIHPIMMERFPAASRDAVDVCEAQVAEADVLIGIYADRYGYCPQGSAYSITEMEYRWAERYGIDRLIFIFDATNAKLPKDDAIYLHADHNPKMQSFSNYVGKQVVWKTFTSPDDLKHQVYVSLGAWKERPAAQKWFRSRRDLPVWARLTSLVLLLVTLIVLVDSFVLMLRAGQNSIGLAAAGIGLAGALLPLLGFFWKNAQGMLSSLPGIQRLKPWGIMLVLQCVVVVAVVVGAATTISIAADDLITQALTASDEGSARAALADAEILGADVSVPLERELMQALDTPNTTTNDEQAIRLARLYAAYASEEMRRVTVGDIDTNLRDLVGPQTYAETQRLMQVLAQLDPLHTGAIAREFYDRAIAEFVAQPPQTPLALAHINAIFAVNGQISTGISDAEISYAYLLHGQALETTDPSSALNDYRQAITVYADNLEAYYVLASGLLVEVEFDPASPIELTTEHRASLNEAVRVAATGQARIAPNFCRGDQDLTNAATFQHSWYCFLLMTTEGGARFLRSGADDTTSTIIGLLQPAIGLAEENNHFGAGYSTAEAYYWLARATEPDPLTAEGRELYCNIIRQLDRARPRHVGWLQYANQRLNGIQCIP